MKSYVYVMAIAAALAMIMFGCGKSGSPAVPAGSGATPQRQQELYSSPIALFTPSGSVQGYHDVDSAVVMNLSTQNPAQILGLSWTIFVSLERLSVTQFVPVFTALPSNSTAIPLIPFQIPNPTTLAPCYRFPKCDAIQFADGSVELAVCYEVLDATDGDWDIGITRIHWANNYFPSATFTRVDNLGTDY